MKASRSPCCVVHLTSLSRLILCLQGLLEKAKHKASDLKQATKAGGKPQLSVESATETQEMKDATKVGLWSAQVSALADLFSSTWSKHTFSCRRPRDSTTSIRRWVAGFKPTHRLARRIPSPHKTLGVTPNQQQCNVGSYSPPSQSTSHAISDHRASSESLAQYGAMMKDIADFAVLGEMVDKVVQFSTAAEGV
jgi:hypothetical protein